MANPFSLKAFVDYGNNKVNTTSSEFSAAFRKDLKANIIKLGCPTKDEISVVDTATDLRMDNTLAAVPALVANYMKDENRAFDLPAPDDTKCPASIAYVHKEEATSEGVSKIGGVEKPWKSTIVEHDEIKVKNRRNAFKK